MLCECLELLFLLLLALGNGLLVSCQSRSFHLVDKVFRAFGAPVDCFYDGVLDLAQPLQNM